MQFAIESPSGPLSTDEFEGIFTKQAEVCGVRILANDEVEDQRLRHAAQLLADYLGDDGDSLSDDAFLAEVLQADQTTLLLFASKDDPDRDFVLEKLESADLAICVLDLFSGESWSFGVDEDCDAAMAEILGLIRWAGSSEPPLDPIDEGAGAALVKLMDGTRPATAHFRNGVEDRDRENEGPFIGPFRDA